MSILMVVEDGVNCQANEGVFSSCTSQLSVSILVVLHVVHAAYRDPRLVDMSVASPIAPIPDSAGVDSCLIEGMSGNGGWR